MKAPIFILLAGFTSAPAFASTRFCTDRNDSDYTIDLEIEGGKVVHATFSNQDHGSFDDHELAPSEYVLNGDTLTYGGDVYECTPAQ